MKKLPIIIGSAVATSLIVGVGLVVAFSPTSTAAEIDLPYVNTRIDNLDARQTNTENDIKSLQAATSTTPAPERIYVPVAPTVQQAAATPVPTAVATPAPTPLPVRILTATWRPQPDTDGNGGTTYYCDNTYSDGTAASVYMGRTGRGSSMYVSCPVAVAN